MPISPPPQKRQDVLILLSTVNLTGQLKCSPKCPQSFPSYTAATHSTTMEQQWQYAASGDGDGEEHAIILVGFHRAR
jgi:hypothetical protein